jgi:hypothetical protein
MIAYHRRKALFPISLSNDRFSTEAMVPAIGEVLGQYDDIILLIADQMQIFNRISKELAAESSHGQPCGLEAIDFVAIERKIAETGHQRERWLDRIKLAIGPASLGVKWEYTNVDILSDRRGFAILRRGLMHERPVHLKVVYKTGTRV